MDRFSFLLAGILLSFVARNVSAGEPRSVTLTVTGMTCASCPITVKTLLKKVTGVIEASVSAKTGEAQVRFDPDRVHAEQLAQAVTDIGFRTTVKR